MTTRPPVVTGFVHAYIHPASGGFGMYEFAGNGEDIFCSAEDLLNDGMELSAFHASEPLGGMSDDQDLANAWLDATGNVHNEPDILVGYRDHHGHVSFTGINRVACHVLASGEYVTAAAYQQDPDRYTLAQAH